MDPFHTRIRRLLGRAGFPGLLAATLSVAALVLALSGAGAFLDTALFMKPALKLRLALGLAPAPHPELRVILFEDRALKLLGRSPTFSEWQTIGRFLVDAGFDRILFLGFHSGAPDATAPDTATPPAIPLIHGVVDTVAENNSRAIPVAELPARLFLAAPGATDLEAARRLVGPPAESFAALSRVGLVNMPDDLTMPAGRVVGDGLVVPNIGLWAAQNPRWDDLATSIGDRVHVNYMDYQTVIARALGASSFFTSSGQLRDKLGEKATAALAGGKVGIIVPDAFTGTRFLDTPSGKVPSFLAAASVANAVMTRRFITEPFAAAPVVALWVLLLAATAFFRTRAKEWPVAGCLVLVLIGAPTLLLIFGIIVPAAQLTVLASVALGLGLLERALRNFEQRVQLARDLELGRTVQSMLFASAKDGVFGPWTYKLSFRPHGAMSGDWYQVWRAPDDSRLVLAIGDVVGKGPSAALCTSMITATWLSLTEAWERQRAVDVDAAANLLHKTLHRAFGGFQNTTLTLAVIDEESIALVNLGGPAWVRVDDDQNAAVVRMRSRNPLGMERAVDVVPVTLVPTAQAAGGTFIAYTDGVMDGPTSRVQFLKAIRETPAGEEPFAMIERELARCGEATALPDDKTLLLLRCARTDSQASRKPEAPILSA